MLTVKFKVGFGACRAPALQHLLSIVDVGLPATQMISSQRSFLTGS
jgi:hypothetical protein